MKLVPGQEIERKFLYKGREWDYENIFYVDRIEIEDYYLSDNFRLRKKDFTWYATYKSGGDIQRDEVEFKVTKPNFELHVEPLRKTRYIVPHNDISLEVNIFKDIKFQLKPLIVIEIELVDKNQPVHFPYWVGTEVTYDKRFYGYNLSKLLEFKDFLIN